MKQDVARTAKHFEIDEAAKQLERDKVPKVLSQSAKEVEKHQQKKYFAFCFSLLILCVRRSRRL